MIKGGICIYFDNLDVKEQLTLFSYLQKYAFKELPPEKILLIEVFDEKQPKTEIKEIFDKIEDYLNAGYTTKDFEWKELKKSFGIK